MRDEVGTDVEPDPDPDPKLVARVGEALATGRTDVPVDLSSRSEFHQEVLRATARIPRGEVRTYGELAEIVGRPRAARAVGTAMARNPVPLLVPCHRVVPSSGGVGNYGYRPELKAKLLAGEGVVL
ncbi:MAG: MGMT family protein [Acidimicrobiaceae bacterium]|nr:MGMT family protein [Acidimicrobiaceae bacterium]MXY11107.1 MGMT family protein [Acidimicrobiaceae bacterium]MXZ65538.1 MGMT family protein [Acidimicrobiaceae bacterium]MYA14224.1 MGMT family protein [Acidimicrobiaceae bacterium]MYF33126.1 MGMT family protein [Acidimicrobiaceae bacterium]